ncbi:hypothetical protein R9C00_03645 [Flammeovirgaceae bacterium SG7u.111]|nr:hypothetical protein [Flammeovirgaceae bacterium SG7u.132]WPO36538.1 hypothetical protein R9C00_03645 [Flammeovirgaceae bacterium SG7u.111]
MINAVLKVDKIYPMTKKLLILSDLWGREKADWLKYYSEPLGEAFEIQYYDCCKLGGVDKSVYTEEALHAQFVGGGIERAVEKLLDVEKEEVSVLAFSIGGTIAWKAGLNGLKINTLFAISSTRLRREAQKPPCQVNLYFGEEDQFKPSADWFEELKLSRTLVKGKGHLIYTESEFAHLVSKRLSKDVIF